MPQDLLLDLDDDWIAAYEAAARRNQRTLEDEIRDVIERMRPLYRYTATNSSEVGRKSLP